MVIIGRHINNITINPLEYLLDGNGDEMKFENEEVAKSYVKENGFTDDDIYWLVFKKIIKEEKNIMSMS